MGEYQRIDPTERAHLLAADGYAPPIYRYAPSDDLRDLVRRYWIPVWSLPAGRTTVQRVLQYPTCLIVIADRYARLVGVQTGLGRQELTGDGWAFGVMLQPAAGQLVLGGPVTDLTDSWVDLRDVAGLDAGPLIDVVHHLLDHHPAGAEQQRRAIRAVETALRRLEPVDEEGLVLNRIVRCIEEEREVARVRQVCDRFAMTERTLQRLTARSLGLTPKWLIQRRRLHDAAEALRSHRPVDLARTAADLGYADQSHFTRDFRTVTGLTPGEFAAEPGRRV